MDSGLVVFSVAGKSDSFEAKIDVWVARTLRRILWGSKVQSWRILSAQEQGVSNEVFAPGQIIMRRAVDKLGMNPDDLQAILWFGEKHVWEDNGWTNEDGAFKSSFDDAYDVFFPPGKSPRSVQHGKNIIQFLQAERLVKLDQQRDMNLIN